MKRIAAYITLVLFSLSGHAQTTINHNMTFSTSNQNMWGAGNAFNLNQDIQLFNLPWNFGFGPVGGIFNASSVGLGQWGATISAGSWGSIGARFYIQGVTGGTVAVDYPIQTNITFPTVNTFNRGEWVTINTGYTVQNGWDLATQYPNAGEAGLEFNIDFHAYIHPKLCAYSCTPSTGFPNLDVNITENIDIFYLSPYLARYPCATAAYTGTSGDCPIPGFGYCTDPIPCPPVGTCLPTLCEKDLLPLSVPDNGFGFSGEFDLPNVVTTPSLGANQCLSASGEDDYITLELDLLSFIGNFVPGPVGTVFKNLSGSYSFGPLTFSYTLFAASFIMTNYNKQTFTFCPEIYGEFTFPNQVEFQELTPGGALVNSGQAQTVRVELGNDLDVRYPCNYEFMEVDVDYDLENDFTNHTYDSLAFDFVMEALGFSLTMPAQPIFDGVYLPKTCCCGGCLPLVGCWDDICVGGYYIIPPITIPAINIAPSPNPLVQIGVPIGSIKFDWVNNTWELGGFNTPQSGGPFTLDPMAYLATSTGTHVDCYGNNTGSMTVNVTNGNAPYTFNWPDGSTTVSATTTSTNATLLAGNNYVTVQDVNGCQAFTDFLITEPSAPLDAFNEVVSNVNCNSNSTGSIVVSMTGGTAPYTYTWTPNVSSTGTASNLPAGVYDLTVTDANNCTYTNQYTVTEPTGLSAAVTSTDVLCFGGSSGTASVLGSGGTYPYTYLWSNGQIVQNASGFTAGNHDVTVTDSKGCTFNVPFVIAEPAAALSSSITTTPVSCHNGTDGTVDLTVAGGTIPYTYKWYNSTFQQLSATTQDLANISADTYLVEIEDANGCTDTVSGTVIEPTEPLEITLNSVDSVLCFGGNTGSIDITVSGGTTNYTYAWSNGQTSEDNTNIAAGNYTVTVTDANGCTESASYDVYEPEALVLSKTSVDVLCNGESTGSIDITVSGGIAPYIYLWNGTNPAEDLNNIPAGVYNVVVADDNGCIINDPTLITEPTALAINGLVTAVNCYAGNDGGINAVVSGGVVPYSYQWNNSASIILSNTSGTVAGLSADDYTLSITDANGCFLDNTFTVTEPTDSLSLSAISTDVLCYLGNDGAVDLTATGGTGPYLYSWSGGQTSQDITNITAGTYTVDVQDANGCTESLSAFVDQPETAVSLITRGEDVDCFGYSTGIVEVMPSGGVGPYTILWNTGDNTEIVDSLPAGTYTVDVTDANGCTAFSGIVLNEPATFPQFTYTTVDVTCYGFKDGGFEIYPSDGITPYTVYFGDTVTGQFNNLVNGYAKDGLGSGVYHVLLQDANGCESNQYITIIQPDSLWGETAVTDVSCFNGSDGAIDLTTNGGTLPYTYLWTTNDVTEDIANVPTGFYTVSITDNNGCKKQYVDFVDQPTELILTSEVSHVSCRDNDDGSIEIFVDGGTENYAYLWSTSEITETIYNLLPGTYVITVTDANGCVKFDSINVNALDVDCFDPVTAFTPDGDGINDTWYLENMDLYPDAVVKVFNKWGNLLYECKGDYVPWTGYYNGKRLPSATYYYIIDLGDGSAPYTGPVTIVINQ